MSIPPEAKVPKHIKKQKTKNKKINRTGIVFGVAIIILTLVLFAFIFAILTLATALNDVSNQVQALQNFTEAQKEFNIQVIQWSQSVANRLVTLENNTGP